MKKSITKLTFLLATAFGFNSNAQSPVAITFDEPTFTLTPNSYYKNTNILFGLNKTFSF